MADYRRPEDLDRIESEAGILATLVHHPEFGLHSEFLLPEHFTSVQNQVLYRALIGIARSDIRTVDTYNIREQITHEDPAHIDVLSKETIDEFIYMSSVLARGTIKEYKILVSNVYDVAFRREMLRMIDKCRTDLLNPYEEDIRKKIYDNIDSVMTSYSYGDEVEIFTEKMDALWDEIESRQGTGYSGIPFKFPALNEYVTIERGELVIFGAQQKVGKSIMLLNCAVDLLQKGYSVLYIDSELSDRLFAARMLAHISGIPYRNLTSGQYTEEEKQKIFDARDWIKEQPFQHCYLPMFDADSIYMTVKQMNHINPIDVLIIDYFKATGNETDAFATYATMGRVTDVVKNELAGAMNIAAIGAAQATATNKLADSAKIARNASTIIMMIDKTPEEIEADGEDCGDKKLIVTLNRNGMQHSPGEYISIKFDGNHIMFEQADRQAIPEVPY
jgi:replicative DNA helicase